MAVLKSSHNLCFGAEIRKIRIPLHLCFGEKIRKIGIPLHTPVLLFKSGVQGGIHYTVMFSSCVEHFFFFFEKVDRVKQRTPF